MPGAMFTRAAMVVSSLPRETCSRNFNHRHICRVSMLALNGCTFSIRREAWHPVTFSLMVSPVPQGGFRWFVFCNELEKLNPLITIGCHVRSMSRNGLCIDYFGWIRPVCVISLDIRPVCVISLDTSLTEILMNTRHQHSLEGGEKIFRVHSA